MLYSNYSHRYGTADVEADVKKIIALSSSRKVDFVALCELTVNVQGGPKNGTIILYDLTLPTIYRFSKLFHYQN